MPGPLKKTSPHTVSPKRASRKAASKVARKSAGKKASRGASGLRGFAMDLTEASGRKAMATLAHDRPNVRGFAAGVARDLTALDHETAALNHLEQALASDAVKQFTRPKSGTTESEFRSLGASAVPLTGTTVVKFCQTFNKIPVYGSLISVELDDKNEFLGINSSLGTPTGVQHIAKVSPARALAVAASASGYAARALSQTPRLYYYFDEATQRWHLAYIIEDVPQRSRQVTKGGRSDALRKDYVVDAQTGKLLAELPRTPTMAAVEELAKDGLKRNRKITVETGAGGKRELRDKELNVTTYGFDFRDPTAQGTQLPGTMYKRPPTPWPVEAVGAHANASQVARFLRDVVKRNNIDNKGGELISTVNCWDRSDGTTPAKQWQNAYWNDEQMVYGQIQFPNGSFYSVANMLDVVGHEMFHGVTHYTSRLEYRAQQGALNESYSDIFGAIIANLNKPLDKWVWKLGKGFYGPRTALRDMKDPTLHDQPKLMKHFEPCSPPYTIYNDYGWVHGNSGIHNFAAYSVMTAKSGSRYLFTPAGIAAMFYIALTVHLSRTSQFSDSRRGVIQAARSLFRDDSASDLASKIKAVEDGFTAAGIK